MKRRPDPHSDTRERVLAAATRLFAARGFKNVTVRDICREAGANLAAINYHFHDKPGLYLEVVKTAIDALRDTNDAMMRPRPVAGAEERLRCFIHALLLRLAGDWRSSWIHRLMSHELSDPTPALDLVFRQVIRPRTQYLRGLVAEMMGCPPRDARVTRCLTSIQWQCLAYRSDALRDRFFPECRLKTPADIEAAANHIAEFSLAGIRALSKPVRKRTPRTSYNQGQRVRHGG